VLVALWLCLLCGLQWWSHVDVAEGILIYELILVDFSIAQPRGSYRGWIVISLACDV
jgi:hypothetical protein